MVHPFGWLFLQRHMRLPLYRRLKKHLLESRVIYADETVVQVLKEDGKPASSESRMWVYGSGGQGGRPVRFFEYRRTAAGNMRQPS